MQFKSIKTLFFVFSVSLLASGCVDMARIEQVELAAANAMTRANSAYAAAQNANVTASEAAYNAKEAEKLAVSGLKCCNDNTLRMERMVDTIGRK